MRKTWVNYRPLSQVAQGVLWCRFLSVISVQLSQRLHREVFNRQESICLFQQAKNLFRGESDRVNVSFVQERLKTLILLSFFNFVETFLILSWKFCLFKPEPSYEYKKPASERKEAFKHFQYMLDGYEIRWKLTWREKKCINQTAPEWKITWFEKLEDRSNFPLPFPQPWGGTRRSQCRRGHRAPGG